MVTEAYEEDAEAAEMADECCEELEDYEDEEVAGLEFELLPAEKRPAEGGERHQEALKRLREMNRPRRDGKETAPPPPPSGSSSSHPIRRDPGPSRPSKTASSQPLQ